MIGYYFVTPSAGFVSYSIFSICSFLYFMIYGVDKYKAVHNKWRIPETTLLVIAVIGVIGAFAGMHVFHHKIRKAKFYVGVPVIFFLEMLAAIGVFWEKA